MSTYNMSFSISSAILHKHLLSSHGAISSNPTMPILENFLFEIKNKKLKVTASDLQTSIITELPLTVEGDTSIAVPARIVLDTLKNLPEQPITFYVDEGAYTISITSDNGKYTLAGENATDFPKMPDAAPQPTITLPASVLKRAIQQTIIATSHDELKPAINGIYMQFHDKNFTFVATDIHRLIRYNRQVANIVEHAPFILPRKSLFLLNGLLPSDEQAIHISFHNNNAYFRWAEVELIARLIDEKYYDYEHVIPKNNPYTLTINRMSLVTSLRRLLVYTNKTTHQIKLTLDGNEITVLAEDLNFNNNAQEKLACSYQGDPGFKIGFNAKLLMELLQNLQAEEITFHFSQPNKAVVIVPTLSQPSEEDILVLIMPITFP